MASFDRLIKSTEIKMRSTFLNVMQNVVDSSLIGEMIEAIKLRDQKRLFNATGFTPAALNPFIDVVEKAYSDGGSFTVSGWPSPIKTPTNPVFFRFNVRNEPVELELRNKASSLITSITEDVRLNVNQILEKGVLNGQNPRKTALELVGHLDNRTGKRSGGVIGLANNQLSWVESVRNKLKTDDASYFNNKLRDKRFDTIVSEAFESGKGLKASDVERITLAYTSNALRFRGESVASSETLNAMNRSEYLAHIQAVSEGAIKRESITKEWDDTGDSRVRNDHDVLGFKYGVNKGIDLDAPFISPSGDRLLHPGDNSLGASASETIRCRCKATYRVDWLSNAE